MGKKIGHYAFIFGILVAIIAGLFPESIASARLILVLLGLVVGLLNITDSESTEFLVAAIALLLVGSAGFEVIEWANIGVYLTTIVENIGAFVAPATVVVAVKSVVELANR